MDLDEHWLFVLLGGMAKWTRDMFGVLCYYALQNIRAEAVPQMDELEHIVAEGAQIAPFPQDSSTQTILFQIQGIKCDHLPKPVEAWIKQAFSVKLLLGGKEYNTGQISGSATTSWSDKISLQAPGSSSLEIEVHNRINGRNKLIGSLKDTVHNLLKESSSVVRTLRKMDRRGVIRETTVELTFSIALLSQESNAGLLVSSFEQLEQPDTKQLERRIPEEVDERGQIDSDTSPLAAVLSNLGQYYYMRFDRLGDLADLDNSIASMREAVALSPDGHPNTPNRLSYLGASYATRFQRLGDLADLENLITSFEQALALTQDGHRNKAVFLSKLGASYHIRFERLGDLADLENSIANFQQALVLTPDGHLEKATRLSGLSTGYFSRFEHLGGLADLESSITTRKQALVLPPDDRLLKAALLSDLGSSYRARFGRLNDLADVDISIASFEQALALTPDGHPNKPGILSNLGNAYHARFERLGDLTDLENGIANFQQAVRLAPANIVNLSNLGLGYHTRFRRLGDLADLEKSITTLQQALALTPGGHPGKPSILSNLGYSYHARFDRLGDLVDVEISIANFEQALALTPDSHPNKPGILSNLGGAYHARFRWLGGLTDLENSITSFEQALALTPDDHPDKPAFLSHLGSGYHERFRRLGDLADLENSITTRQQALALTPDGHPSKPGFLSNLSHSYYTRFERLGDLVDESISIASIEHALLLTPADHPDKPMYLSNLGNSCHARFKRLDDLADLQNLITTRQQALALTPDGHPDKPDRLLNLGNSYYAHFKRLGELADLENSIVSFEQALPLTLDSHINKPDLLSNISDSYRARFRRLDDLADLEKSITTQQQALALTPDGHPDKPPLLSHLGSGYHERFQRLGDLADLENSITTQQQALALTPDGHPDKLTIFSNLGSSYYARFERLGELADLDISIVSFEQALALTPDSHPNKPGILSNLGNTYYARFERLGNLADHENMIASIERALVLTPASHPDKPIHLSSLGGGYHARFERLGDLADLENSIATQQQALALTPDGHPDKPARLSNLGGSYRVRFERLRDLADLENSITTQQQALALTPDGHPNKPGLLSNLSGGYRIRLERFGDLADVEVSIASSEQALALTPAGHPKKLLYLLTLGNSYQARFEWLGDLADLENSIASYQEAVRLAPAGHLLQNATSLSNLGSSYYMRFNRLGDLADLENSLARFEQALALTPDGHPQKAQWLLHLGYAHATAWDHTHDESYLHNALLNMQSAAQSPGVSPRRTVEASREWATLSLKSGDMPSALQALRTAIEILPQVAWLGLDIASRQDWLVEEKPEELGCMAATCAIRLGRFEEAVELLDMARSVFWQQASSVRKDQQNLKAEQPELAEELEAVSQKLDTSSFSGLSTASSDPQLYERRLADHRGLVLKRETLIKEIRSLPGLELFLQPTPFNRLRDAAVAGRVVIINISILGADALIFDRANPIRHAPLSKIYQANSFKQADDIELKQTSADDTQSQQRCLTLSELWDSIDVDILQPISRSLHGTSGKKPDVTTTDGMAPKESRADVTEDHQSSQTLPLVWEHIIHPIFIEVGIPVEGIQGQVPTNRIFWYLTGPLTFIPIHAAGPVSQLVVSSYVTTLSSLAEAQKRQGEPTSGPPRLLAITQPDTPGQVAIPYATNEVNSVMDALSAKGWRQENLQRFDRADATIDQVSTALDSCSWAHFACHAMQHSSNGMESAFALHDGRLKLSLIAAKRLSSARFAFLSTCESASGLVDSPGEAMHLSAGMQFAGFSSVIATMTSIRDDDAPIVAKHTYAYLLRNGLDNIDLTEAAAALHYAVSRLREDPNVTVERWAPFVYYGV